MTINEDELFVALSKYKEVGISQQLNYEKFNRISMITLSAALEGCSLTETESLLLLEENIPAKGKDQLEQQMIIDLRDSYEFMLPQAISHTDYSIELLIKLSAMVMRNTGKIFSSDYESFNTANGDLRKINIIAGAGGRSYPDYKLVYEALENFCKEINMNRHRLYNNNDVFAIYRLSFYACYLLESIHPWAEGNGRVARLVMNAIQYEFNLIPSKVQKENKAEYINSWMKSKDKNCAFDFQEFMMKEHINNIYTEIDKYLNDNMLIPNIRMVEGHSKTSEPQTRNNDEPQQKNNEPQQNNNEPQYEFSLLNDPHKVTLNDPHKNKNNDPHKANIENTILKSIANNNKVTREELAKLTGTSVSTIKRRLKKMVNLVEFIGSGYSGHWEIKK